MSLIRFNPCIDLIAIQERMNRLFEDSVLSTSEDEAFSHREWSPAVDIYEGQDSIVLKAELPGLDKDDLSVTVENDTLIITGEKKREKEVNENSFCRMERSYGKFHRSFTLPKTVDTSKLEAKYKNGVLELTLPKVPEAKPKQIEVTVH